MRKNKKGKIGCINKMYLLTRHILHHSPSPDLYKERLSLQSEFDTLTTDHAVEQSFL